MVHMWHMGRGLLLIYKVQFVVPVHSFTAKRNVSSTCINIEKPCFLLAFARLCRHTFKLKKTS